MSLEQTVSAHYSNKGLLEKIYQGLEQLGFDKNQLTQSDLSSVDEFHIGGSEGTLLLAEKLSLTTSSKVLDIGCGIGGPARLLSSVIGCNVSGIDLTADYINAGNELTNQVGLSNSVNLVNASALDVPFPDGSFDVSYMIESNSSNSYVFDLGDGPLSATLSGNTLTLFQEVQASDTGCPQQEGTFIEEVIFMRD